MSEQKDELNDPSLTSPCSLVPKMTLKRLSLLESGDWSVNPDLRAMPIGGLVTKVGLNP